MKNGDEISHIGRAAYVELVIKQPLLMATIYIVCDLAFFFTSLLLVDAKWLVVK